MFTKLTIIDKEQPKKEAFFKLRVDFETEENRIERAEIKASKDNYQHILDVINELPKLKKWFSKLEIDSLTENDSLKDALLTDIFMTSLDGIAIRYDADEKKHCFCVTWYDEHGYIYPVDVS